MRWCTGRKVRNVRKMMLFKVDFEKAYDSVSWDYLDRMMEFMGFGVTWRMMINGCLDSSWSCVLINGNPSQEFKLNRVLRQGDPLSPFLFLMVMEGLHVCMKEVMVNQSYKGVKIGNPELYVSHFFYVDDAMFLGEWDKTNLDTLLRVLKLFYMASGLQLNLHKSRLAGIGVPIVRVLQMAAVIGCEMEVLPFTYLGLPVGANMGRVVAWESLLDRFNARLSKWRMKLLSIGGRLTLLKSVLGSLGTYYFSMFKIPNVVRKRMESCRAKFFWGIEENEWKIHWTKWDLVLNDLEHGGLAVGSLHALDQSLIYKWRWRFLSETKSLWKDVVICCHGVNGGFSQSLGSNHGGVWRGIIANVECLHNSGIIPLNAIRWQVRNGEATEFWHHVWCGDNRLAMVFPRLYRLATNMHAKVADYRGEDGWQFQWWVPIRGGVIEEHIEHLHLQVEHIQLVDGLIRGGGM